MKGLTKLQYVEVLDFIEKHHKFCLFRRDEHREFIKKNYPNLEHKYGMNIKYIESSYDTRDSTFWALSFTANGVNYNFRTNSLIGFVPERTSEFDNLYDTLMAFLKGELTNHEYFIEREEER